MEDEAVKYPVAAGPLGHALLVHGHGISYRRHASADASKKYFRRHVRYFRQSTWGPLPALDRHRHAGSLHQSREFAQHRHRRQWPITRSLAIRSSRPCFGRRL